jgi:hypothetical protein
VDVRMMGERRAPGVQHGGAEQEGRRRRPCSGTRRRRSKPAG